MCDKKNKSDTEARKILKWLDMCSVCARSISLEKCESEVKSDTNKNCVSLKKMDVF